MLPISYLALLNNGNNVMFYVSHHYLYKTSLKMICMEGPPWAAQIFFSKNLHAAPRFLKACVNMNRPSVYMMFNQS